MADDISDDKDDALCPFTLCQFIGVVILVAVCVAGYYIYIDVIAPLITAGNAVSGAVGTVTGGVSSGVSGATNAIP